jgi:hypothetical protein
MLPVFVPEELQRQMSVLRELIVNRWVIRWCSLQWRLTADVACQTAICDPVVIPFFCHRPPETGGFCPPQVVVNCGLPDGAAGILIGFVPEIVIAFDRIPQSRRTFCAIPGNKRRTLATRRYLV